MKDHTSRNQRSLILEMYLAYTNRLSLTDEGEIAVDCDTLTRETAEMILLIMNYKRASWIKGSHGKVYFHRESPMGLFPMEETGELSRATKDKLMIMYEEFTQPSSGEKA